MSVNELAMAVREIRPRCVTSDSINALRNMCHEAAHSAGWWHVPVRDFFSDFVDPTNTATMDVRQLPSAVFKLWCASKIALIMSEGGEGLEGLRKGGSDQHLQHRSSEEVEIADIIIRSFDYAGGRGFDIGAVILEKLAFNAIRADHKAENRAAVGGKAF